MTPSNWMIFAAGLAFGTASGLLLLLTGQMAGFSGVFRGVLMPERTSFGWKAPFLAGAVLSGGIAAHLVPGAVPSEYETPMVVVLLGGLLVGIGSRMGNGCTSGHGVCGVGRMSRRSITATATFVATGIAAVALRALMMGGA
ncbi:MAG: YeeE/YedE thiosulfate transporter family protein [Polyangiales bacterium]